MRSQDQRVASRSGFDELHAMAEVRLWGGHSAVHGDEIQIWRGRRITLYRYNGGGFSFRRDHEYLADDYAANLSLGFLHEGEMTATSEGQTQIHRPGGVAAFRMDRPLESRTEPGTALTVAHLPFRYLESRGIDTRQLNGQCWEGGVLCAAVLRIVDSIFGGCPEDEALVLEAGIIEVLIGILAEHDSDQLTDDITEKTRARAMQLIDEHYTDVELDADRIAAALGSSRRYLYGLFEGRGPSIATLIRDRRAAHAEQLLIKEPSFSIRRIAHLSGFGSEDRLLRTFKQMTGESPSSYRRRVAAGERVSVSS